MDDWITAEQAAGIRSAGHAAAMQSAFTEDEIRQAMCAKPGDPCQAHVDSAEALIKRLRKARDERSSG